MESWRFTFAPVWPWPLIAVTMLGLVLVVLLTYLPKIKHLPLGRRRALVALRLLSALTILFGMLRPAVEFTRKDDQSAELLLLTDRSKSMTTADGPAGMTRRAALLKTLTENAKGLEAIAEKLTIRQIEFDESLVPAAAFDVAKLGDPVGEGEAPAEPFGRFTAIGKILDDLRQEENSKRTAHVILMSDGAQRATGEADIDPRGAARRWAERKGVPIHTVPYGTTELTGTGIDVAIEDMLVDPFTYERKTVPVRAQLRMVGVAGRSVKVRLLIEDRTGKKPDEAGAWKELPLSADAKPFMTIEPTKNSELRPILLSFVAEQTGEYKIAIEATPLDGELKTTNNRRETLITVSRGGLKVAYFDVARHEQRFIRKLNQTARIQLDLQVIPGGAARSQFKFDPKLFEPRAFDVYIIGDVPASAFKSRGKDSFLEELASRVQEGAGLAMLGGVHNYDAGGYADSPIGPLLPVRLDQPATTTVDPQRHVTHKVQMLPTPEGESHYLMQLSPADNDSAWRSLPKIGGANRLEPKNATVDILAESEAHEPLLIATDVGRSRVACLGVDETWLWHLHGHADKHQRFWQQFILWLAKKEIDSDAPIWVKVQPRNFAPGGRVPLEFGARDANKQPITDATYQVEVVGPDGKSQPVTAQAGPEGGLAEFTQTTLPGDYQVKVSATKGGKSLGLPATTRFIVNAQDLELDNPAADHDLLSEIAQLTGTETVPPEQFGQFLERLLKEGIATDLTRREIWTLWDGWPLLAVFATLMALEWVLRKRTGLV